jgi:hypothetical protein
MVSMTAMMRAGYYIVKMFPQLLWLPLEMRTHLRRARDAFEDQLLQSGLNHSVARELAKTYHEANKEMISQITSPRSWA